MKNETIGLMLEPKMKMQVLRRGERTCIHYEIIDRVNNSEIGICKKCGREARYYYERQNALYKNYGERIL